MKFIIKNFQSISYQEFVFNGFTILVGSSNLGKSATVRALRAILYNEFDKSFIRAGEHTTELELLFDCSNNLQIKSIKFIRSYEKGINSYIITYENGSSENFEKVGTESPDLIKFLGYKYLEIERTSSKINLNFQNQLEGLFLFNSSEVEVSSFFNKIFNIEKYENALRNCNADISTFSKSYNKLQKEISKLESEHKTSQNELQSSKENYEKIKNAYERYEKILKVKESILIYFQKNKEISELYDTYDSSKLLSIKLKKIKNTSILISNVSSMRILEASKEENKQIQLINKNIQEKIIKASKCFISISSLKHLTFKISQKENLHSIVPNVHEIKSKIYSIKKLISVSFSKVQYQTKSKELYSTQSIQQKYNQIKRNFKEYQQNLLKIIGIRKIMFNQATSKSIKELIPNTKNFLDYINQNLAKCQRICPTCNSLCKH